jgi:hypothetical protein
MQSTINSKPSYEIGGANSSDVKIISPVVTKISTDIEMLEQEVEDITGLVNEENFNKNISVIFSDSSDAANAKEIAQARITAEKIKNSGVFIDDLDFGFGACALNIFEFPGASLNSQNLQSTAGDIIKLKKDYSAYYNAPNNQNVIEHPTSGISCAIQINTVRQSLIEALRRSEGAFFQFVDFESDTIGVTNDNLVFLTEILSPFLASTGQSFEENDIGPIDQNLVLLDRPKEFVDFESDTIGTTTQNLVLFDTPMEFVDFESASLGTTDTNLYLL